MRDVRPTYDDEISLIEVFQIFWGGKWKIAAATLIAAAFGVVFSIVMPSSFLMSTPIKSGKQSVFLQNIPLNDLLNRNGFPLSIDKETVFSMFVAEFNDYDEMIDAVSSSEHVQEAIKQLDATDRQRALIEFAKLFELREPTNVEKNWTLYVEWHDDLEGERLFDVAIQQTLTNLKNAVEADIDALATIIDIRNARELENLRNQLGLSLQRQLDRDDKRVQYLVEQSAIAKKLGIDTNTLDTSALSQSSTNSISLSVNANDIPYYLRGFKAIDKEISIIQNRSGEQRRLNADGYIETKEKIRFIENDLLSSQLREALAFMAADNPSDWIEFDLMLADRKAQKRPWLYVALSAILGGMIGVIYVFVLSVVRSQERQTAGG